MKVAVVGLGLMGIAIAESVLAAGNDVAVYNRTAGKAASLVEKGARLVASPSDAASHADVVITIVTNPAAVESVTLGPLGILAGLKQDSIHVDMSTVLPESAAAIAAHYLDAGKNFLQAPVLGSVPQIKAGKLVVVAGGASGLIDRASPVWSSFSNVLWRFERAEQASLAKLAVNGLIGHMILGLGQSLLFAKKGGVDPTLMLQIIQTSALASPMYSAKGNAVIGRNFTPNFTVDNLLKDLTLIQSAALATKTPLPINPLTRERFIEASAKGFGDEDYSAVLKVLEESMGAMLE